MNQLTHTTETTSSALYRTSPIKRKRRTNRELDALVEAVVRISGEDPPITIRHLFYRLVGEHMIEKTEQEYSKLCAMLATWRRQGRVSFDVFTDATRFYYGPTLFDDMGEAIMNTVECYRKNLWITQPHYVELSVEKDAVRTIIGGAGASFGVQTFACRGFASLSSLANAARTFRYAQSRGKAVHVLYFGDHDPSGKAIDSAAERTLAEDFGTLVEFKRIAVLPEQIESFNLPTRPVKNTDTRAKGWTGGCVEIDTIKPSTLRSMVEREITSFIDQRAWNVMLNAEKDERENAKRIAARHWRTAA